MKERTSAGAVISRLARQALGSRRRGGRLEVRNGVPVFPASPGEVVTVEQVERLLEDDGR